MAPLAADDVATSAAEDLALMQGLAAPRPEAADALGALYDRHAPLLLGICMRLLRDRAEAEDVLEEVFVEIWQKAGRYDASRASPLAYLVTVARSRSLDRLRRRRREERARAEQTEEARATEASSTAVRGADPLQHALASEQRGHVLQALAGLAPAQREAVELSFLDGLSHAEIAARLGTPLGTVKSWIRKGLLHLRESLRLEVEGYGGEEPA